MLLLTNWASASGPDTKVAERGLSLFARWAHESSHPPIKSVVEDPERREVLERVLRGYCHTDVAAVGDFHVDTKPKTVQALTLRIPVADYNLLRAEAFVRDWSINEVVLDELCVEPHSTHRLLVPSCTT